MPQLFRPVWHQISSADESFPKRCCLEFREILGSLINHVNKRIISKFSECWIPDNPQRTLSGYLSQNKNHSINCQFLGTLSRFVTKQKNESLDILAIVSGPEPQRSLFEKIIINQLSKL